MKCFEIRRPSNSPQGILGTFQEKGKSGIYCRSLELPWRDNQPFKSCIPPGLYRCIWNYSPTFKRNMYLVLGVPQRSGIRMHPGSYAGSEDHGYKSNFLGCFSLGLRPFWDSKYNQMALSGTYAAMSKFERYMEGQDFMLEIIQHFTDSI